MAVKFIHTTPNLYSSEKAFRIYINDDPLADTVVRMTASGMTHANVTLALGISKQGVIRRIKCARVREALLAEREACQAAIDSQHADTLATLTRGTAL